MSFPQSRHGFSRIHGKSVTDILKFWGILNGFVSVFYAFHKVILVNSYARVP